MAQAGLARTQSARALEHSSNRGVRSAASIIDQGNRNLAQALRPLHPAIDRLPLPAQVKSRLKTRPLDALLVDIFQPIEEIAREAVREANRTSGMDERWVPARGAPNAVLVKMDWAQPDEENFIPTERELIRKIRTANNFLILAFQAPRHLALATAKALQRRGLQAVQGARQHGEAAVQRLRQGAQQAQQVAQQAAQQAQQTVQNIAQNLPAPPPLPEPPPPPVDLPRLWGLDGVAGLEGPVDWLRRTLATSQAAQRKSWEAQRHAHKAATQLKQARAQGQPRLALSARRNAEQAVAKAQDSHAACLQAITCARQCCDQAEAALKAIKNGKAPPASVLPGRPGLPLPMPGRPGLPAPAYRGSAVPSAGVHLRNSQALWAPMPPGLPGRPVPPLPPGFPPGLRPPMPGRPAPGFRGFGAALETFVVSATGAAGTVAGSATDMYTAPGKAQGAADTGVGTGTVVTPEIAKMIMAMLGMGGAPSGAATRGAPGSTGQDAARSAAAANAVPNLNMTPAALAKSEAQAQEGGGPGSSGGLPKWAVPAAVGAAVVVGGIIYAVTRKK